MPKTVEERFWQKVDKAAPNGCWEWTGSLHSKGYGQMSGSRRGDRPLKCHRVSWELHRGPVPDGLQVLHRCDNRRCVNPDHLFLGTAGDNSRDMVNKGRVSRGERHPFAKLTAADVTELRRLSECGRPDRELAAVFGTSERNVRHVVDRDTWKHVT